MIIISPTVAVYSRDPNVEGPNPAPAVLGGTDIRCDVGALQTNDLLPAATVAAPIVFPGGVATAKVVIVVALTVTDLVVTYKGQAIAVPARQPVFLYGLAAADVTLSTALGGKVAYVVGG